jgi:two-component system response regulator LytT
MDIYINNILLEVQPQKGEKCTAQSRMASVRLTDTTFEAQHMKERDMILLVDDEVRIVNALKRVIQTMDIDVLTATDPEEAMRIIDHSKPDVVICDYNMPKFNGIHVLKYAKGIVPNAARVLMTGLNDVNIAISAINEGSVFYYITKPWKNEDVISMIRNALEKKRTRKERSSLQHILRDNSEYLTQMTDKLKLFHKMLEHNDSKFPIYDDEDIIMVNSSDILYLTAMEGDVFVITADGKYKSHDSLNTWSEKLGKSNFFRCHRSYIVNIDKIEKISPWFNGSYNLVLTDCKESIPVSRENMKVLRSMLGI